MLQPQPSGPHQGAAAVLPVNVWVNGEFANQLDLDTYEYTTLAQLFARDVTSARAQEYVSPDGSLFLPAGRVFRQGPDDSYPGMDDTGWRWSHSLDAYGLLTRAARPASLCRQRCREPHLSRHRAGQTGRSPISPSLPSAAARAWPWTARGTSMSPTARSSSTTRPARWQAEIDVPERPIGLLFGGPDRRTLFILTHHTLYAVNTRNPGEAVPWDR